MSAETVFKLAVEISVIDQFTAPIRQMTKLMDSLGYSKKNLDMITKSMKNMGASSAEIDKVTASMNKLQQNRAWANIANDLKAAGLQQPEIDKMANSFQKVADAQTKAAAAFQKYQKTTVTGATITGVGLGIADMFGHALEKAGELQLAVKGVGTAMKLNDTEMQKLSNMSMTLGIPTMFDSPTTAKIIGAMYTAGLSKQQVLDPKIAQLYVNFADVQAATKGEAPEAAVADAASMAHSYQLYSTPEITPFLNNLNAILMQSHQTLSEFRTQYAYIASEAKKSGLSSTDAINATAWIARMGIGGGKSGGTSFADFLMRSYFGSSGQKADDAMVAAGLVTGAKFVPAQTVNGKKIAAHYDGGHSVFYDDRGNFVGMDKASQIMQDLYKRYNGNMNQLDPIIQAIWGTQGGRVASALMSQGSVEQWHNIQKAVGNTADVNTIQSQTNNTYPMQMKQLKSTLTDIEQAFGQILLPSALQFFGVINKIVGKILDFDLAHPKIFQLVGDFGMVIGALTLIIGPFMTLIGVLGMAKYAMAALDITMDANPIGLLIVAIGALVAGIIWCIQNWNLVRAAMAKVWATFQKNPILWFVGGPFTMLVGAIAGVITNWDVLVVKFEDGWASIKNYFIDGVNSTIGAINKLIDAMDKIPGVNIGHIDLLGGKTMTSEMAVAQGLTDNQARRAFGMVNGSHAAGLGYVPFDGYIAELHRGEMVLTAQQAASLRGSRASSSVVNTMNKVGGGGGTTVIHMHFGEGAVQIDAGDRNGQDLFDEMFNKLGPKTRQLNMSRPFGPNRQVFG